MSMFNPINQEIQSIVKEWYPKLLNLDTETITQKRNSQGRTIKQITGHMVDSATNNLHRVIHLQYQPSPLSYPDYANHGNNDRWIAIQNYQEKDWKNLVELWKYLNIHFAHTILQVNDKKLANIWTSAIGDKVSLKDMITDYPRHIKLHINEIIELINQ